MAESRMLKAVCRKNGKYFGLQLERIGGDWKVVNMIPLADEEQKSIYSEVKQPSFVTNDNLLACTVCHNRTVGGCSCSPRKHTCSPRMGFEFDCIYCNSFQIDYSRSVGRTPYTKWAGISNIPDAVKDRFGNPQGSQYDLAQDGSFTGYTVVVLNLCDECDFTDPRAALNKKGFRVVEYKSMPSTAVLKKELENDQSQLWVISHRKSYMRKEHVEIIAQYFYSGHGVYIWGDNDPYYADANLLLTYIFNTKMYGDYYGDHVLGIQMGSGRPGIIPDHPITTGIVSFYEGITIATVDTKQVLLPLLYNSAGAVVAAYYDGNGMRSIVDGGFTRLCHKWDSAGTDRYVVNAAAWLTNIERFGYYG